METEWAMRLASDILMDHFGGIVARVGMVLLERGPLSVQDLMRFTGATDFIEEPLKFSQVRNALLVLLQHGIVTARMHPQSNLSDSLRSLLQVYSADMEEVMARLRFPHFLEHVYWTYGDLAQELVHTVMQYGRASASFAIARVRSTIAETTVEELEAELRRLVQVGLLSPVQPCGTGAVTAASAAGTGGGDGVA
eukprot:CAMPEP_0180791076 /NCGR_PEP_ID=MMETSP1038_2-20121128/53608_1 /TAXON_ID=632150 /ORGANISM="Azadinium spinosum, Strain 3D9" /LENGTH=194 /DNA_ID=CAMNT_0022829175 /DNA_START=83 /DNA_END=664 /DNA_ORIENTATION=-